MCHWNNEHALAYDRKWGELEFHKQIPTLAGVCANDNIVEIGCGGGFLAVCLAIAAREGSVLALDPTEKMIELAERKKQKAKLPNSQLKFLCAGAEQLKVRDKSIDLVVAAFSLHHWSDAGVGLKRMFNGLKKGGRIWLCEDLNTPTNGDIKVNANLKAFAGIRQALQHSGFINIGKQLLSSDEGDFLIVTANKPN